MPLTLDVDWEHAHQLFNQGLKIPRIAEQLGVKYNTVSARAKRYKWAQKRDNAVKAVAEVVHNMVKEKPNTVQERAQKWLEKEMNAVEDITIALDAVPIPETIPKLREHIEVRAMNGKYGRSTFGLDNQQGTVNISIGMFGKEQVEPTPGQVIDVELTPQLPPSTPEGAT
jgi:hypothetical protein